MRSIIRTMSIVALLSCMLLPTTAFAKAIIIKALPYTITAPGNYALAKNLTLADTNSDGITIHASDVTLDMSGFGITGPGKNVTTKSGIAIDDASYSRITIKNGYVTEFYIGIYNSVSSHNTSVINIKVYYNGNCGILMQGQYGHVVRDCYAEHNDSYGIGLTSGIVIGNFAFENGSTGIAATHSVVRDNVSRFNTGVGIYATNCTVVGNDSENNPTGIYGTGSLIDDNIAINNTNNIVTDADSKLGTNVTTP